VQWIGATSSRALGILAGGVADAVFADPRRGHPVAAYGRAVARLERRLYRDSRGRGLLFTTAAVGVPVLAASATQRACRNRPFVGAVLTAAATWAALGGTSLAREGAVMARLLETDDLPAARRRLSHLCAREADGLTAPELARATVESLAENTSDAVVAPAVWAAVAGLPGVVGYRAANTLDAMVGYLSPRYTRFGWASARFDDLANWVPARLTGVLTVLAAPLVGGNPRRTWRVLRTDAAQHPSPNAGHPEAAAAGALGVTLGGVNTYGGHREARPTLGDGRAVTVADLRRAVRLTRWVSGAGVVVAAASAAGLARAARGLRGC